MPSVHVQYVRGTGLRSAVRTHTLELELEGGGGRGEGEESKRLVHWEGAGRNQPGRVNQFVSQVGPA